MLLLNYKPTLKICILSYILQEFNIAKEKELRLKAFIETACCNQSQWSVKYPTESIIMITKQNN